MINWLYIYLINNKKHMRRQRLAPYCVAGTSTWCLCKLRHCAPPGVWMFAPLEHAPLHVVPRTWPLTSSLLYKHFYSFRPQGLCRLSFLCVLGQYRLRAWALKKTKELLLSLDAIRVGQDRESHILYLILKNSIWSTSFLLILF